ncbi:helix-turn-helix transcriptional regulator [Pseudomonadota bacterium]
MADKGDRKYAVYKVIDYLRKTPGKQRTSKQILDYLQRETEWGKYREENVLDGGMRHVQLILEDICNSTEFQKLVECTEDREDLARDKSRKTGETEDAKPPKRREKLYQFVNKVSSDETMEIEEACCIAMAEKFLDIAMPADFYDASLHDLYRRARATIKRNEDRFGPNKRAVKSFVKRIEIAPRGQQLELIEEKVPYEVLNTIYSAILNKCCLEMRYKDSRKIIHPYAVIIREPKFYLLGVDDAKFRRSKSDDIDPNLYLCNRIENAVVTTHRPNRAPADYSATDYVKSGKVDVPLWPSDNKPERKFTLELVVYALKKNDNLLQDLEEFPLSRKQTISKEPGTDNYLLTARDMRATHQLVEWIVGRIDRVEVKAPEKLRSYVVDKINAMQQRYAKI